MKKIIIFILSLCFLSAESKAQCYIKYTDASGIPMSDSDLHTLEDSACALLKVFPNEVQDSFAVVDFGFYSQNQNTVGGYPEFMNLMIKRLESNPKTKYYLLFGRESGSEGPNTRICVKVVLPQWGKFSCMSETQRSLVKIKIEKAVRKIFIKSSNNLPPIRIAEVKGMMNLMEEVVDIITCCDKGRGLCTSCLKKEAVIDFFDDLAMSSKNVTIPTATIKNEINTDFAEYAEVVVSENGQAQSLNKALQQVVSNIKNRNHTVKIFLTADANFCFKTTNSLNPIEDLTIIDKVKLDFEAANEDYVLWINASMDNEVLFIKSKFKETDYNVSNAKSCYREAGRASALDKTTATALIDKFLNDEKNKTVWTQISKQDFCAELKELINDDKLNYKSLYQDDTNLCGVSASLRIMVEYAPKEFVRLALNLYEKGLCPKLEGGGPSIISNPQLYNKVPTNGLTKVGYVVMTSVRNSFNLSSYDPENSSNFNGLNWPGESSGLLKPFGCIGNYKKFSISSPPTEIKLLKSIYENTMHEFFLKDYKAMKEQIQNGCSLIALINAPGYDLNKEKPSKWEVLKGNFEALHYIVISDIDFVSNDKIKLNIWSWGNAQRYKAFIIDIEAFMSETYYIWSYK